MIPRETLQELVQLRARVEELEAEIEQLRGCDQTAIVALHKAFGTTIGESMFLVALAAGGVMHRDQLLVHGLDNPDGDPRLVDSMVKRVRRRVPWLQICTHYGFGYELEGESLLRVRRAMRGQS